MPLAKRVHSLAGETDALEAQARQRRPFLLPFHTAPDANHSTGKAKMIRIHHDKETFSEADLTRIGAHKYAVDPSTDCLLTSGLVEGEKTTRRWRPGWEYPYADIPPEDIEIHAWNSQFERLIWNGVMVPVYGWPELDLEQFVCVSAQARSLASGPAKLDVAGQFFQRRWKKDNKGHLHMLKMCRPATEKQQLDFLRACPGAHREAITCHHTPDNIDRLHDYCDVDVFTEFGIAKILPDWSQDELDAFWESERINDRGIVVDVDFARAATAYADEEKAYFARRISEITRGQVTTPRQFDRIKKWALPRMSDAAVEMTEWYDEGVLKNSFDADTRANLMAECALREDFLDGDVLEFVEVLDMAGNSTVSKYQTIADRAMQDEDGNWRVCGLYMFAGAAQSGRYSSTGIQVHNLKRDVCGNAVELIQAFKRDDRKAVSREVKIWCDAHNSRQKSGQRTLEPEPIHALGRLVRPTITGCPQDGFDLAWCDWSSIEACVLPWLSLDPRADDRLELLRRGEDLYLKTASGIVTMLRGKRVTITKEDEFERQAFGKVPELSLGYLGGVGAFLAMAKNYGVHLPEREIIKIVAAWREENPWAVDFGNALEMAAQAALLYPGSSYSAGRVSYRYDKDALDGIGALFAMLPSGRELCYPAARLDVQRKFGRDQLTITAAKAAWRPKKGTKDWPRVALWRGLLAENATQAVATGDLLNAALLRCAKAGLAVCAHTHDEIMIETPAPERDAERLLKIMLTRPRWPGIDALPLKAEVDYGFRYKVKFDKPNMEKAA